MRIEKVGVESQPLKNNPQSNSKSPTPFNNGNGNHVKHDEMIKTDEIKTVVEKLNGFLEPIHTNLQFKFHEKLNEYYVTVVNPLTNEIIKEIPPKKMLDMYAAMAEFMGILIDEKI